MNQPSTMLFIRPSGYGKTYTLLYEITEKGDCNELDDILICPTIWINKT